MLARTPNEITAIAHTEMIMTHNGKSISLVAVVIGSIAAGCKECRFAKTPGPGQTKSLLQNDLMFFKPLRDSVSCA